MVQAVDFNGTYYYYLRNGQGDIVKLIDGNRNTVVEYAYDSWGKPLFCTGTLATTLGVLNPFRYRGYVYDEETQWYYLKSRYYDPETCRFISADVLLSTGQGVLGHNTYAYCLNNSSTFIDSEGNVCYVFYLSGWKNEAIVDKLEMMKRYGFSVSEVKLVEITCEEDFVNGWENMVLEPDSINVVIINTHGNPEGLGPSSGWLLDSNEISQLSHFDIDWVALYGCNAGFVSNSNKNPANAFAGIISGDVYAADGTVLGKHYFFSGQRAYRTIEDTTFIFWLNRIKNGLHKARGWVSYHGGQGEYELLNTDIFVPWEV